MVLLLSTSNDNTTNLIIDWLYCFKEDFIRINNADKYKFQIDYGNKIYVNLNKFIIELSEIGSVYFRRSILKIEEYKATPYTELNLFLKEYHYWESDYINKKLDTKTKIGSSTSFDVNKLIVLDIASECGLKIPKTYFNPKFLPKNSKFISKSLTGNPSLLVDGTRIVFPVSFNRKNHSNLLLQEYVEKKYELRIFYLHGKFWSMAIFSQNDEKTKLDFRNYNHQKPNRTVPYKLPKKEEDLLDTMMKRLKLNTGSIDMIVNLNNEYVFLEVNPVGQFGMVSYPCNYQLEKEIAKYLSYEK